LRGRPQIAWFGEDPSDTAQATLVIVLCLQGFLDQARHVTQICIDRMQLASQKLGLCYTLAEAACPMAFMTNDLDAAAQYVTLFVNVATALDLAYLKTLARAQAGLLLVRQGDYEAGVNALRESLEAFDKAGGTSRYSSFLSALAEGLAGLGRTDEARLTLDQALARADRNGEEGFIPPLLCRKGALALQEPGPSSIIAGEDCFGRALTMARQQGALLWELRSALHLARLRVTQKRPEDARQILAPVYGQFVEGFETVNLRAAKTLLDSLPAGRHASAGATGQTPN
jgi:tetratricopeptide (TPR) repeat protein